MNALAHQTRRNVLQALLLSLGLHLLIALSLDVSPGSISLGVLPSLRVSLRGVPQTADPVPTGEAASKLGSDPAARADQSKVPNGPGDAPDAAAQPPQSDARGIAGQRARDGSSVPILEQYYRRSQLDVVAEPLASAPLIYPEDPYIWRLAGRVLARVYINERGTVDTVHIVEAQPSGVFEAAAIEALRQVRYRPAEIAGTAVKSQKLIEVIFDPYEKARPQN